MTEKGGYESSMKNFRMNVQKAEKQFELSEENRNPYDGIKIENESQEDYEEVEILTRKAFWNVHAPGCEEHYLAHILRSHADFIPELDFVARTADGRIVGNVMYTRARLTDETGKDMPILTFGPLSVHPDYQRRGIGKRLLEYSFQKAAAMGYGVIVIFGDPGNYVARGFVSCRKFGVTTPDGKYPAAMLVKELREGALHSGKWIYQESPAYEYDSADAAAFDKRFEPMQKEVRPGQEIFYILSHAVIREE